MREDGKGCFFELQKNIYLQLQQKEYFAEDTENNPYQVLNSEH
jgi:hypothetical protein